MSRFNAYKQERSSDIHASIYVVPEPEDINARVAKESGPVKLVFDLSQFTEYGESSYFKPTQKQPLISVRKNGVIRLSCEIGDTIKDDQTVKLYLNKKGNILIVKPVVEGGLKFNLNKNSSERGRVMHTSSRRLVYDLIKVGCSEFPVRFKAEWNNDMQAWIGRR